MKATKIKFNDPKEENEKQIYENGFNHGFSVACNLICKHIRKEQRNIQTKENYLT